MPRGIPNKVVNPFPVPTPVKELTPGEYVTSNFDSGKLTIDQIAENLKMTSLDVMDILKAQGYQFPEGM